jgi:hypothetical protein
MQYGVLISVLLVVIILILWKNLRAYLKRVQWKATRQPEDVAQVIQSMVDKADNEKLSFTSVSSNWRELANIMQLDAEKLRPDDKLVELAKLFPFPEMLFDDIEEFLSSYGVKESPISDQTVLADIINFTIKFS